MFGHTLTSDSIDLLFSFLFAEFWEDHFKCKYPNGSRTPYNTEFNRTCTGKEKLSHNNTAFENQLQFVSDAVMAFAHALNDMHKELCHGKKGLCEAMKPTKGSDLLKYLRKVDFRGKISCSLRCVQSTGRSVDGSVDIDR
jgi:Receptor family ligand binding region.